MGARGGVGAVVPQLHVPQPVSAACPMTGSLGDEGQGAPLHLPQPVRSPGPCTSLVGVAPVPRKRLRRCLLALSSRPQAGRSACWCSRAAACPLPRVRRTLDCPAVVAANGSVATQVGAASSPLRRRAGGARARGAPRRAAAPDGLGGGQEAARGRRRAAGESWLFWTCFQRSWLGSLGCWWVACNEAAHSGSSSASG